MSTNDSAFAYQHYTAVGASPVGQVVALYDVILRDFRRAIAAVAAGQIEKRVEAVNHALVVIGELQGVLDFKRGGEPARNLDIFYKVARSMVTRASILNSQEAFEELVAMFTRVRAAWSQIERAVPCSEPVEHLRAISEKQTQTAGVSNDLDPAPSQHREDSGGSRWSA